MNTNQYREIDITRTYETKLFSSLCIPSFINSYSMCVEYMQAWFLEKFDKNYFKSIFINDKHIMDEFRKYSKDEMLKRLKPALSITPQMDLNFDREKVDLSMNGIDSYLSLCRHKEAFFKDKARKVYIGLTLEALLMNFTYRIKLSTKAQAMDIMKFMKMAFRVGNTQGKNVNMDFHVPYKLMIQLAQDVGFGVKDNKIVDLLGFMYYINKNSQLPFLYKLRNINGQYEFFIKIPDLYIHINNMQDLSVDDGEREGHLQTNYIIEMQCAVRFPCPKFYSYYSYNEHSNIKIPNADGTFDSYTLNMGKVPTVNEKGWNQFMTTEYSDENYNFEDKLIIDFSELVGDLREVIDHTKSIYLSPDVFVDIKLYNDLKDQDIEIDWNEYTIKTVRPVKDIKSFISIYVDLEYMNNQLINIKEYSKGRLK